MVGAPKNPLIAITGATGTGKSKLAVALAKRFGGEVINGDALQLYEGLPIVTNKIRLSETCGVRHHLLGRLGLDEETWSVSRFTREALRVIECIKSRGKLPILVGGTHYYTQSLLLHGQTLEDETWERLSVAEQEEKWPILKGTEEQLFEKLREVDPVMASRWHPKDTRKVRRSLEVWLQTGKRASELYAEQHGHTKSSEQAYPSDHFSNTLNSRNSRLRFESLILCTHVEKDALDQRISDRVDEMLTEGLLHEVHFMYTRYQELLLANRPPDITRGIWIAIGYKEFSDFLAANYSKTLNDKDLMILKEQGIEKTKIATRQYAKRQVRWIRNKLLPALLEAGSENSTILLPCNKVSMWPEEVERPAIELAGSFLEGRELEVGSEKTEALLQLISGANSKDRSPLDHAQACEVCGVIMTRKVELERHPHTTRHKRALRNRKNLERANQAAAAKLAEEGEM